jgi:hypothetical protein
MLESDDELTPSERVDRLLAETHARWRNLSEERLDAILTALERVDRLLVWVDRLLYWTQPPATGRLRIVWERDPSKDGRRHPVLVKWVKGRSGRWRYERLQRPSKAVRGKGGFATHREEVERLVGLAMELMDDRSALVGYLGRLGQGWSQKKPVLSEREVAVANAMLDIVDSVNAKGTVRIRPESVFT